MSEPRLLRLHADDNVLTVISPLAVGDEINVAGTKVGVEKALPMGHKVAARDIAAGEKIIKYGVPIGSASRAIRAGEHVHTHNVQSDYIPTYLREDQERLFAQTH
jgi:altronate dehydratase